jgi:dTDP-4-dehydrorhamnose reductase
MKILIIGASGMLGNALFSELSKTYEVYGTVRSIEEKKFFSVKEAERIIPFIDIENTDSMARAFIKVKPDVVLNAVGLIKQNPTISDTRTAIYMNAMFPHILADLCKLSGARMIHFSTDCVFSGTKGSIYKENDFSDAEDIYGKTKFLGEVAYDHCVTMRTSIIGHGLEAHASLADWFLAQSGEIQGYTKVIYSGLPTVEIARIIGEYIIPNKRLKGLYQVSAEPIPKYELLQLIAKIYGKKIIITPVDKPANDRSLDSNRFRKYAKYTPPSWPILIKKMYQNYQKNKNFIQY